MARSAHAYVRGSTARFYQWLAAGDHGVPFGPPVWICGDCHLGNLGPLADGLGGVAVQIRDLDQTVIGNPSHDLIRLGLSLASEARGARLPGVVTAKALEAVADGYAAALADAPRSEQPESIRLRLKKSARRRWRHLAAQRLATTEPVIPLGRKFWALSSLELRGVERLFETDAVHALISGLKGRDPAEPVELLDAAYWIKGCSSLGRLRYAVLLKVGGGVGADLCLVDVKEAAAASAPSTAGALMPADDAARVVAGAQALSPNLGARMLAAPLMERSVVVRELMPQDLKLKIGRFTELEAVSLAAYLGRVVGRAHARQMNPDARAHWLETVRRHASPRFGPPTWLWSSVVDLLAIHERAYLEHCRDVARTSGVDAGHSGSDDP